MKAQNAPVSARQPNFLKTQDIAEKNITVDVIDKYSTIVSKKHPSTITRRMNKDAIQWFDKSMGFLVASLSKDNSGKIVFGIK